MRGFFKISVVSVKMTVLLDTRIIILNNVLHENRTYKIKMMKIITKNNNVYKQ